MPLLCLIALFLSLSSEGSVVARVNGEPLSRQQLEDQQSRNKVRGAAAEEKDVLAHLILYRLALQEARRQKLDQEPEVEAAMDKVLYQAFLDKSLAKIGPSAKPSASELKALYQSWPWVRLRHLALMSRNPAEDKAAQKKLSHIQKQLQDKVSFEKLVLAYSEDPRVTGSGGDLDFVGHQSLAPEFYEAIASLKVGEVSKPLNAQGAWHLFQVTERKSFSDAPASYKQYLADFFRNQKESLYLTKIFSALKEKATITIPSKTEGTSE